MKWFWLGAVAMKLAAHSALAAPDPRVARLDAFYTAQAADSGLNGNVLVAENGKPVYVRSFGFADFDIGRPNTAETEFELASVSKVFTAIAVLQEVERGRIGLDTPYARYEPTFPYKTITVRQLLSHSSGIQEAGLEPAMAAYEKRQGRAMTMADLVPAIAAANVPLTLKPGEKWWYCNLCYSLLVHLVETKSGQRFDAYLSAHILKPAGMAHTYLKTADINRADTPAFAQNYDYPFRYSSQRIRYAGALGYYNTRIYGAANIVSTAGDMLKLDTALYNGRLLRDATLKTAYENVPRMSTQFID